MYKFKAGQLVEVSCKRAMLAESIYDHKNHEQEKKITLYNNINKNIIYRETAFDNVPHLDGKPIHHPQNICTDAFQMEHR